MWKALNKIAIAILIPIVCICTIIIAVGLSGNEFNKLKYEKKTVSSNSGTADVDIANEDSLVPIEENEQYSSSHEEINNTSVEDETYGNVDNISNTDKDIIQDTNETDVLVEENVQIENSIEYVLNTSTHKVHISTCRDVPNIDPENYLISNFIIGRT